LSFKVGDNVIFIETTAFFTANELARIVTVDREMIEVQSINKDEHLSWWTAEYNIEKIELTELEKLVYNLI
jgi:hypothetical protein